MIHCWSPSLLIMQSTIVVLLTTAMLTLHLPDVLANRRSDSSSDDVMLCPSPNRYLTEAYRCRPTDFTRQFVCEGEDVDMHCPRGKLIVIRSAVFGWSNNLRTASDSACSTGQSSQSERSCPVRCVLTDVNHTCHGKRKCNFEVNIATFGGGRCASGATKHFAITYTCVQRNLLRALMADEIDDELVQRACGADLDSALSGGSDLDRTGSGPLLPLPPSNVSSASPVQTTTTTTTTTTPTTTTTRSTSASTASTRSSSTMTTTPLTSPTTQFLWYKRNNNHFEPNTGDLMVRTTTTVATEQYYLPPAPSMPNHGSYWPSSRTLQPPPSYSDVDVDDQPPFDDGDLYTPLHDVEHHSDAARVDYSAAWIYPLADWLWTWQFANENREKFILYMSLGLCIGTITVLMAVIFHFVVQHRRQGSFSFPSTNGGSASRRSKPGRTGTDMMMSGSGLHSGTLGSSCASPTWHDSTGPGGMGGVTGTSNAGGRPAHFHESESSTGDDRTLNDPDDVEMPTFNHHVDSLPRRGCAGGQAATASSGAGVGTTSGSMMTTSMIAGGMGGLDSVKCQHQQQQPLPLPPQQQQPPPPQPQQPFVTSCGVAGSMVGPTATLTRPGSSLGGITTTTATINRTYAQSANSATRCLTPAPVPSTSTPAAPSSSSSASGGPMPPLAGYSNPPPPAPTAAILNGGMMTIGHMPNGYGMRYSGYQIGASGVPGGGSGNGGGGGAVHVTTRGPMIGSLGRSYSSSAAAGVSQYGGLDFGGYHMHHHHHPHQQQQQQHNHGLHHPSYDQAGPPGLNNQDAGSRTLQSVQHYYG